jgi:hypothetical protein
LKDFNDVNKGLFIVLRVTPSEKHSLSDYVDCFKPDVKIVVVRHPAQQLASLASAQPGETFERVFKSMERSLAFKAVVDEVLFFESMFLSRHFVKLKLRSLGMFSSHVGYLGYYVIFIGI